MAGHHRCQQGGSTSTAMQGEFSCFFFGTVITANTFAMSSDLLLIAHSSVQCRMDRVFFVGETCVTCVCSLCEVVVGVIVIADINCLALRKMS